MNHSKVDQWRSFCKVVKNTCATFIGDENDILLDQNNVPELETIKEMLMYVMSLEKDDLIPIQTTLLSYKLYQNLLNHNVTLDNFLDHVALHIEDYVTKNYGDFPDSHVATFTIDNIQMKMTSYIARIGRIQNTRGEAAAIQDSLKIVHFACYMYYLITKGDPQAI